MPRPNIAISHVALWKSQGPGKRVCCLNYLKLSLEQDREGVPHLAPPPNNLHSNQDTPLHAAPVCFFFVCLSAKAFAFFLPKLVQAFGSGWQWRVIPSSPLLLLVSSSSSSFSRSDHWPGEEEEENSKKEKKKDPNSCPSFLENPKIPTLFPRRFSSHECQLKEFEGISCKVFSLAQQLKKTQNIVLIVVPPFYCWIYPMLLWIRMPYSCEWAVPGKICHTPQRFKRVIELFCFPYTFAAFVHQAKPPKHLPRCYENAVQVVFWFMTAHLVTDWSSDRPPWRYLEPWIQNADGRLSNQAAFTAGLYFTIFWQNPAFKVFGKNMPRAI